MIENKSITCVIGYDAKNLGNTVPKHLLHLISMEFDSR